MLKNLRTTIIQTKLFWEDVNKNLEKLEEKIEKLSSETDLIILPEMFTTGFTMQSDICFEPPNGLTEKWMTSLARKTGFAIVGSYIVKELNDYFNRLLFVKPNGEKHFYNKRHLFRMADEHNYFTPGRDRLIVKYKGWKICPLICYDLRFPVFSRNKFINNTYDYDLLIYVANWPSARKSAWINLLEARAHENLCYSIGVNRVGEDGKGISYSGNSNAFNYKGEPLIDPEFNTNDLEFEETVILSKNEIRSYREKFPAGLDADNFNIEL